MKIGRKSGGEIGFLVLRRGVTCESFQADEKVEEFRERLKRSRMTGKITGKLSITRRRFMLSGPVEMGCMKRGRVTKNVRSYVKEVEDRRIRYEGRRRSGRSMQGCRRGEVNGSEKRVKLIWRYFRMGVRGFGSSEAKRSELGP